MRTHRPGGSEGELAKVARELDELLQEAVQDFAFEEAAGTPSLPQMDDEGLLAHKPATKNTWLISPRVDLVGKKQVRLRLVVRPPRSKVLLVRAATFPRSKLEVKAVVMLRDLLHAKGRGLAEKETTAAAPIATTRRRARSQGKAVLAVTAAAYGGFLGYGLQKASRSDDPRLLYPLMALGTGVGLGASLIVADEWDVGLGDAWYLNAGFVWPTTTAAFLTAAYEVNPTSDRYAYALLSGLGGAGLATFALSFKGIGEGAATFAHSSAVIGMYLGGATQIMVEGDGEITPKKGLGFGAGLGILLGGTLATQIQVSPARVLLIDLGAALGTLGGAAAASPLLFQDVTPAKQRIWMASTLAGTAVGATIATLWTRESREAGAAKNLPRLGPTMFRGNPARGSGPPKPIPGLLLSGQF